MKTLMCGLVTAVSFIASAATADKVVTIDGVDYFLSHLTENCRSIKNDPAAQIACFNSLAQYLEKPSEESQVSDESIVQALEDLRTVAQYQDNDSGLLIAGSGCKIRTVYFDNYFHISRRNISAIDVFSAEFDLSKMEYKKTSRVEGSATMLNGVMESGANATVRGGASLESTQHNFAPRSPGASIDAYATEVVNQLPASEDQTFQFGLFHPQRIQASSEIWNAFVAFADVCKAKHTSTGPKIN